MEYRVGDRVRCLDKANMYYNKVGTVLDGDGYNLLVGYTFGNGHCGWDKSAKTIKGTPYENHCWFMRNSDLELVYRKPQVAIDGLLTADAYRKPQVANEEVKEALNTEGLSEDSIIITRKGNTVTAFHIEALKEGRATCSPSDTFDLYTGASIALLRLLKL